MLHSDSFTTGPFRNMFEANLISSLLKKTLRKIKDIIYILKNQMCLLRSTKVRFSRNLRICQRYFLHICFSIILYCGISNNFYFSTIGCSSPAGAGDAATSLSKILLGKNCLDLVKFG